jgi:hypothetical protein
MFGSEDDEKDGGRGFLSQVLPYLGVGAAAWGLGGGTFSALPSMRHYGNLGDAVSTNLGSLGSVFGSK